MADIDPLALQIKQEQNDAEASAAGVSAQPTARLNTARAPLPVLEHPINRDVPVHEPPSKMVEVGGKNAHEEEIPFWQQDAGGAVDAGPPVQDSQTPLEAGPGTQAGNGGQSPEPAAPDGVDPIAAQLKTEQDQADATQAQLLDWRAQNDNTDAGRRAEVLRYSAASNLPPAYVESNLDLVKKKVDAQNVDWQEVAYRQPSLVQFLTEKPAATPLVKDDTANLGSVEWALTAPFHAFSDAMNEQRTIGRQFTEAQGLGSEENRKAIEGLEQTYANKDYGAENFFSKGLIGFARMLPLVAGDIGARIAGGALGTFIVGGTGAAAGGAAGAPALGAGAAPGAAAGATAGVVTGAAVGQFLGSGVFNYYESVGPLYWRLSQLKDSNGKPMDPAVARAFAQGGAVVQAGLMAGVLGKIGGSLPGAKQLFERFGIQTVEKALLERSTAQALKAGALRFGEHWATGAAMMAGQSAISAASLEGAKEHSGQPFDVQWGNVGTATVDGFKTGMQDMWLMSAIGPGRDMLKEVGRARASAESSVRLEAMTASAKGSKLLERLPQGFQDLVSKMKEKDGAVTHVFVPVDAWTRYWQGEKLDPGEVAAAVVGDEGKAYADAVETKGDVAIPVEKYLTKLGKTDHAERLQQDAKLRSDELTPRQFGEEQKALGERMKAEATRRGDEFTNDKREVNDFIQEQALAAGVDKAAAKENAKVVSEYAGAMALRLGVSVREAANLGALGQLRILGPKGEAVAQAARERFQQFLQPAPEVALNKRLESMSPDARIEEVHRHGPTGLLDEATFNAAPAPAGKPLVGRVSLEGIKYLNDNVSHDHADQLYRVAAKTLNEAAPDSNPAFIGGDFAVRVKDQAELNTLLGKVNEAMPVKGFKLSGSVGPDFETAGATAKAEKGAAEAAGTRAKRGEKPLGFTGEPAAIKFPEGRARASVPEKLAAETRGLSNEEYFKRTYKDATGAFTAKGWENIPRKAHVVAFDLSGLGLANEVHGTKMGDEMIARMKRVAMQVGGKSFDFAHLHGDEYAAQHNDPRAAEAFVNQLKEELSQNPVEYVERETGQVAYNHLHFWYGIGERSYENADQVLNERKREFKASGAYADPEAFPPPADARHPLEVRRSGRAGPEHPGSGEGSGDGTGAATGPGEAHGEAGAVRSGAAGQEVADPEKLKKEALAAIVRMTDPERQAHATAWFRFTEGIDAKRPTGVPDALKKQMAEYGVVDPEGFDWNEQGRNLQKPLGGPKVKGEEPEGFRLLREARQQAETYGLPKPEGDDVAFIEGKPVKLFQPGDESGRGSIQLQLDPNGRPREFRIDALAGDRSTLLHETAHFLSWSLHDIATSSLATPDVAKDYGELIGWAGYESPAARLAETKEHAELAGKETRTPEEEARLKAITAKEERISHGWEQYMLEGKAPSEGLARTFSRFKDWLLRIYKGVQGVQSQYRQQFGQEIALSDDVRGIFDRLLAGQEALDQAKADTSAPEPAELFAKSMSPAELEAYRNALAGAKASADQELAQHMAELEGGKLGEARVKARAEVTPQVDSQPVYRAMRFLQTGELVDENGQPMETPDVLRGEDGEALKVNRKAFVDKYGPDVARTMPPGIFSRTKKGGVDVEQLAPVLGYDDGQAMVEAFGKAEPRDKLIERQIQSKVDEQYGPALQAVQDAAMSAVHNDAAARATLMELRALAKEVDPSVRARVQSINLATLKEAAGRLVSEGTVGDLDPSRFARAERSTALKAAELWGAGKKAEALEQREARLFNQLLYRAARDAKLELDKAHDKLEGTSEDARANMGKADASYRDVHDSVLAAVGLADPLPEGKTLDQMLQRADDDAQQVAFDVDTVRRLIATPKDWDSLSVDEARAVVDASTNIRHIARQTLQLDLAGKKQTKDAWFADFEKSAGGRKGPPPVPFDRAAEGFWDKVRHLGRGADALLTDVPETYSHMLDVGDREGPVHKLLVDARLAAREKATELTKQVLQKVMEKYEHIPKDIRKLVDKRVDVSELLPVPAGTEGRLAPVYTRSTLWSLFLNWGNEGNRQRIRDGQGWSDENVSKALGLLSQPELKFLQGVLDTINGLYPEIAAVHEKRTGLKLGKVEATPITVNGVEYPGGYFPLKYRTDISRPGELQEGDVIKSLFAPNYVRPGTAKGHTKARLEKVDAPVDLSWGVVPAHLSQVIHDLSYGDWVRQVGGVLLDPRFKSTTSTVLGLERAKEFVPWLRDVANAKADSGSAAQSDFLQRLGGFARNRAAVTVMGMNLPAILPQVLDPWNAMQEDVSAGHVASAYVKVNNSLASGAPLPEFALSKELAYRDAMQKENLRSKLGELGPSGKGLGHAASEVMFALYELSDRYTSRVTWKAAFDHALSDGMQNEEAAKRADDVVRRSYASHDIAEKPPIMRTKRGFAGLVMFYSFANRLYNSMRRSADTMGVALGDSEASTGDKTQAVGRFAAKLMFMGLTGAAVSYIAGRGPSDGQDRLKWLAWRVGLEPFNTAPFVGGILEKTLAGQKVNVRTAPELALVQDNINRFSDAIRKGDTSEEKIWATAEALIALAGGPASQIQKTTGYLRKLQKGDTRPRGALDVAGGLIYGEKADRPANPLTDLQGLTSGKQR